MSGVALVVSMIYLGVVISQEGDIKATMAGALCISTLTLAGSSLSSIYMQSYCTCLFLAACLTKSKPGRLVILLVMVAAYLLSETVYRSLSYFATLLLFKVYSSSVSKEEGRLITMMLTLMATTSFLNTAWQTVCPSSISTILEATFMCFGLIALEFSSPASKD